MAMELREGGVGRRPASAPLDPASAAGALGLSGLGALALRVWAGDTGAGVALVLGLAGVIAAIAGVAADARHWGRWMVLAAASALAGLAVSDGYDSLRLPAFLGVVAGLAGAALALLPLTARLAVVSVAVLFHFLGIFTAATSPPPTPWLSHQLWVRVYRPYLQATYLNNAYHFYSPEPGPACQMWACIKYKTDDPEKQQRWVQFPRRPDDYRDPLGMSYYRRLGVTEAPNAMPQPNILPTFEEGDVQRRRQLRADIPMHPILPIPLQFRPPTNEVQRQILPSYARHFCRMYNRDGLEAESVKIYRVTHRIVEPAQYQAGQRSYDALTYLPYFQGEYGADGTLLDSKDPMLWWCVPILARPKYGPVPADGVLVEGPDTVVEDYVSRHAGKALGREGLR